MLPLLAATWGIFPRPWRQFGMFACMATSRWRSQEVLNCDIFRPLRTARRAWPTECWTRKNKGENTVNGGKQNSMTPLNPRCASRSAGIYEAMQENGWRNYESLTTHKFVKNWSYIWIYDHVQTFMIEWAYVGGSEFAFFFSLFIGWKPRNSNGRLVQKDVRRRGNWRGSETFYERVRGRKKVAKEKMPWSEMIRKAVVRMFLLFKLTLCFVW